tara:strand:- start:214 stop:477 length:264 start_codon:yes stop_codon:yes gene_type:complete
MAYFAELNEDNIVTRVLAVPDEQEDRGQEFLAEDLKLGGRWIQTSFNARIRMKFASIGDYYNEQQDIFEQVGEKPLLDFPEDDINGS